MCVVRQAWGIKYAAFVTSITYVTVEVNSINTTRITDITTRVSARVLLCKCKITYQDLNFKNKLNLFFSFKKQYTYISMEKWKF